MTKYHPSESDPYDNPGRRGRLSRISGRLREAAQDPELRAKVSEVVRPYGEAAIHGAMIEAGVAKVDKKTGRVKVRKLGAIKAVLRPVHTVRKAVQGAVGETRSIVRSDVKASGRRAIREAVTGASHTEDQSYDEIYTLPEDVEEDRAYADLYLPGDEFDSPAAADTGRRSRKSRKKQASPQKSWLDDFDYDSLPIKDTESPTYYPPTYDDLP